MKEYWVKENGSLLIVTDELHHEDLVVEEVISRIFHFLGIDRAYGEGWIDATCELNDVIFPERYGWDEDDPFERLRQELVAAGYFLSMEEARDAFAAMRSDNDARAFAIKYWKWIRVTTGGCGVSSADAEMGDLTPSTLKRLGTAMSKRLPKRTVMRVSIFGTENSHDADISSLIKGELTSRHSQLSDTEAARATIRRLDVQSQPKFYGDKLGDSYSRLLWQVLRESATS